MCFAASTALAENAAPSRPGVSIALRLCDPSSLIVIYLAPKGKQNFLHPEQRAVSSLKAGHACPLPENPGQSKLFSTPYFPEFLHFLTPGVH
jgi:hypothetical protein